MHDTNLLENQPIAWTPSDEVKERAQLTKFMRQVGVKTFDELYQFSIDDVEKFTEEVLRFLDIKFDPPYEKLLDLSGGVEFPNWLEGAGLNITQMCLDRWQTDEMKDQPAVIWEGEDGEVREVTYAELLEDVELCAAGLRANGLGKGDAVGIHLPMIVETVVALLAINRIGAIAVPVFSGYGVEAIASRMNAVGAKGLITCFGFSRRAKKVDAMNVALKAAQNCKTIQQVFVCTCSASEITQLDAFIENFQSEFKVTPFGHLVGHGLAAKHNDENFSSFEPTLAEDPLIILYTSGTTGKPKGIAHTHASFPLKAAQDMAFGTDVGRGTRISWLTDIGWMMGPWLIYGALINGATICIYDGAPDFPQADRMWEFCAKHKVEILGISPTLVRSLATHGDDLPKRHDLSALRAFASTGEPWNPAPWWWLFEKVGGSRLPIINYSGGTEISGGILMGNPLLPQKPCSFPAPCPGMDVDILDENGKPVSPGEVGELVIKQPWIGMARGFWRERERYLETYWSRFENIWVHGDWAMRDRDGHWFILGRSDDTLKVAGKRVGPAEVESLLVAHEAVAEAAVIGIPDEIKGTAMVAFVVLGASAAGAEGEKTGEKSESATEISSPASDDAGRMPALRSLEDELKALVAKDMGKPLAPSRIHVVSALPKTRNAKVMRRVIRAAYLGEDAGDLSALENPHVVEEIRAAYS
jgi:acetyl-CoA synthetase